MLVNLSQPRPIRFQRAGGRFSSCACRICEASAGESVSEQKQEIAMSVKGDKVECAINGTVVATYEKSALVGAGKLKSTDGIYGIRFSHNTEGTVSGLTLTKQ